MIKVHVIFNAHLDPIWLWSWRDGLDEVLNTSYYICDLLDRHPDIIYTRGEAWIYEQIERIDPVLFARIRAHVKAGRWSTVGGWYIQPDCNAPSGFAMARQISLGQKMFRDYFGAAPRIGYNVDSFGHAATLPEYMRQAGQTGYVMMRPQEHEMKLPARLFRWRGYTDGPGVPTFRIANAYCTPTGLTEKHVLAAISELPEGVNHTMCFIGVGDHGGGPTEEMIEWCRSNRTRIPGVELVFSSPEKFFEAIQPDLEKLPLVTGELQMHAVGCYTVHRPVKTALRRAEHRMIQAETALQTWGGAEEFVDDLLTAWKLVCFHQFHDTLGGTCLPSAYEDVAAQLGRALAIADEISSITLRRHLVSLPADAAQRLIFFNASDLPFEDLVEIEPWIEWSPWQASWQLHDENAQPVEYQVIAPESQADSIARLLLPLSIGPAETKILRIVEGPNAAPEQSSGISASPSKISATNGPSLDLAGGLMNLPSLGGLPIPELALYDDSTDTWSHGIDRFARKNRQSATWLPARLADQGPLMASLIQNGVVGSSPVQAEWRVYRDRPWIECLLRVNWTEHHRVLKLEVDLRADVTEREDGILGGSLRRAPDGRELPLRGWTRLNTKTEEGKDVQLAIVAPEIYALDGDTRGVALTLLRSPLMAWHDPHPGTDPRGVYSDRGEHIFRLRFMAGPNISVGALDRMAFGLQRPPLTADFTRGMKNRALRKEYQPPTV
jgi:alpha-mannosidase